MTLLLDSHGKNDIATCIGRNINNSTLPDVYAARIELVNCTIEAGTKIPDSSIISGDKTQILWPCDFGDNITFDDVSHIWDDHKFGSWCKFHKHSSPIKIGNNNTFGYGTQLPALTVIGDDNKFGSGAEIGNFASIGNNNTFGRNSVVSLEEITAIGKGNKFLTGAVAWAHVDFETNGNILIPPSEGKTYEGQIFDTKEVFPSWTRFVNCQFNEKCRFGPWSVFEWSHTSFVDGCEFGERTVFHISKIGNGHAIGSWSEIRHLSGNTEADIPYGTAIGKMNRVGYGAKISHGVKMGDSNFIDSGAQIWNFAEFWTGNRIGRFSEVGKECHLWKWNVFYPGCSIASFVRMWPGNVFDKTIPPYQMWDGSVDQWVRRNVPRIRDRIAEALM